MKSTIKKVKNKVKSLFRKKDTCISPNDLYKKLKESTKKRGSNV